MIYINIIIEFVVKVRILIISSLIYLRSHLLIETLSNLLLYYVKIHKQFEVKKIRFPTFYQTLVFYT